MSAANQGGAYALALVVIGHHDAKLRGMGAAGRFGADQAGLADDALSRTGDEMRDLRPRGGDMGAAARNALERYGEHVGVHARHIAQRNDAAGILRRRGADGKAHALR